MSLKKWLNIRKEDFEKVCKEIGAKKQNQPRLNSSCFSK